MTQLLVWNPQSAKVVDYVRFDMLGWVLTVPGYVDYAVYRTEADGRPTTLPTDSVLVSPSLKDYAKGRRDALLEGSRIYVTDIVVPVKTDRDTKAELGDYMSYGQRTPGDTAAVPAFTSSLGDVRLTPTQVQAAADMTMLFRRDLYTTYSKLKDGIVAGTVTTRANVDAAFAQTLAGYRVYQG